MKRYALFAGEDHYPKGGWMDFVGAFDDVEAAVAAFLDPDDDNEWFNVVDLTTGKIVAYDDGRSEWVADDRPELYAEDAQMVEMPSCPIEPPEKKVSFAGMPGITEQQFHDWLAANRLGLTDERIAELVAVMFGGIDAIREGASIELVAYEEFELMTKSRYGTVSELLPIQKEINEEHERWESILP
jgi:hypothetical protein